MLKSKKKIFAETRKGFQAIQDEKAYDQAVEENPESLNLRLRAQSLLALGRREEALPLFQQALALHTEEDHSAAAAAARHDLAHALSAEAENFFALATARQLYSRALESPTRQRAPLRSAETESSLAVCLRRMAHLVAPEERAPLFEEIERRYRSALWRLEGCGQMGLQQLSEVHLNLANFLGTERGEVERAIREYDRAAECARRAHEIFGPSRNAIPLRARLSSASLLRVRGRKQDLQQAERLAKEVIQAGDPLYQALARMELAEIILAGDAPDRETRARTLLEQVRWNVLDQFEHLRHLAVLLRRSDGRQAAIELLGTFIEKAIRHRALATISDFEADAASIDMQDAAELVARILAQDQQDALHAFLALENTSGFRFAENLSSHVRRPQDPLAKALYDELSKHMGQTYMLDSYSQSIKHQAPDGQREFLDNIIPQLKQAGDKDSAFMLPRCIAARKAPVPSEYFDTLVEQGTQQVLRLRYALAQVDTAYAEVQQILNQNLGPEELKAVLRQHPGSVLVRIFVQDQELLAITVCLEGEELKARSTTCPIRGEVFRLVRQAAENIAAFTQSERLAQMLRELDLSAALPPGTWARAVLLPSHVSTYLPLAALGPDGSRLIDRFESLIWLPSLFPLRTRPAPTPPRKGEWVVIPGGTRFHPIAFQSLRPNERCLEGEQATLKAIQGALAAARTLSIYTHGEHPPGEWPQLELPGGMLDFSALGAAALDGMERVEIWACQSGTNLPHDPMTRPANEGYGLDHILLTSGVRTAIGTQWSVPDLVTATVAREYRRRLALGDEPARALTGAQRHWLEQNLPLLIQCLRTHPVNEAIASFAGALGLPPGQNLRGPMLGMLGPLPDQMSEQEVSDLEARLSCPVSWAGIRFVGLPEWKPEKEWTLVPDRALTAEERAQLEQLLAQEPPAPASFDELQDQWLESEIPATPGESPSPERALAVARLLRDRLNSSQLDNLLAALAWVHEALAVPGISPHEREQLSIEAAHLWLDVAQRGDVRPMLPHTVPLARAELLLANVSPGSADLSADATAARARLSFLQHVTRRLKEEPDPMVQAAIEEVLPALTQVTPGTFEALRVATTAAELIALGSPKVRTRYASHMDAVRKLAPERWPHQETLAAVYRLRGLLERLGGEPLPLEATLAFLPPRDLVAVVNHKAHQEGMLPGAGMLSRGPNEALNRMEGALWGYPTDDRAPLVRMTGTLGPAYRWMLNGYLAGHARARPDDAVHLLACLQYSCDLRLTVLHRLARLPEALKKDTLPPLMQHLWELLRMRRLLHTALADAALFPAVDSGREKLRPHALDPYALPSPELTPQFPEDTDLTAWSLGEVCHTLRKEGSRVPHTAAFEATCLSAWIEADIAKTWARLLETDEQGRKLTAVKEFPGMTSIIEPGRDLEKNEKTLREMGDGHGVLGLVIEPSGELLVMACWNDGHTRGQRTFRLETGLVQGGLMGALHLCDEDFASHRGTSSAMRRNAWSMVETSLAPVLESLLREAQTRKPLRWSVLAPGALRELPLLGLRVAGKLLAHQVEMLVHMPSLGFSVMPVEPEAPDFTACLLARDREKGTTWFGEAAVETLRRIQPPHLVADPRELDGSHVVEVRSLESHASRIRTLRLYGVGKATSLNDTLALLQLEGRRAFRERNTHGMLMPRCEVVELWACTAGSAGSLNALRNEGDRIPGLAASFLANGALAVIDLAWPVHDIIKALVCEQYGLMRRRIGHRPDALSRAICMTEAALQELRQHAGQRTVRQVLEQLDHLRRTAAAIVFEIDPSQLVPYAGGADSPLVANLSGEQLVEELCQPAHLAAFRWWGV